MPACNFAAVLTPGGQETMVSYAVRCAMVNMRVRGIPIQANLGGVAVASFPEVTEVALADLEPGGTFGVEWDDAFFYGEHPMLGPMHVRLRANDMLPGTVMTRGTVQSQAPGAGVLASPPASFFPAININSFYWRISLPRLGATMDSAEPLENSAVIDTIPPINSVYKLTRPVTFTVNRARSKSMLAKVVPEVVVESCSVKLQELKHLNTAILVDSDTPDKVTFRLLFKNESTEDSVTASWVIWPRPEEGLDRAQGSLRLGRDPVTVTLALPRDIFYRDRFLAVAIVEPFETKGAVVSQFPAIA